MNAKSVERRFSVRFCLVSGDQRGGCLNICATSWLEHSGVLRSITMTCGAESPTGSSAIADKTLEND